MLVLLSSSLQNRLDRKMGYLLLFVDGDDLFCAHACGALSKLASIDAARVSAGVWCGVPLLEKLAAAACKETRAVGVLEALTSHAPARAAMLSLAAALAGDVEEDVPRPPTRRRRLHQRRSRMTLLKRLCWPPRF